MNLFKIIPFDQKCLKFPRLLSNDFSEVSPSGTPPERSSAMFLSTTRLDLTKA